MKRNLNERNPLHLIVYDMEMLGEDARGLLRATLKLHPQAGILTLCGAEGDDRQLRIVAEIDHVRDCLGYGRVD